MIPVPASNDYYNLGQFSRPITTTSPDAQTWFTRGLIWVYAFNHGEATYCFNQAIAHDPCCAMAYWGLAYAVGPNYNKPWERFDKRDRVTSAKTGYEASRAAKERCAHAAVAPWEKAVIDAIQVRFDSGYIPTDPGALNRKYAGIMERVYRVFGDDIEIAVLYADALMNITPWALWNLFTGEPAPNAPTMLVKSVLERALAQDGAYQHPGLLHLYIHYIEMSPNPELGINVADRLRDLVPDAGHIHHMPTHLDILVGDWKRSIVSNHKATLADEKYLRITGPYNLYTFYRLHNYHSLIYAAMFAGQRKTALDAVTRMEQSVPEGVLRMKSPPMADWLENFLATRLHIMIRFGMWTELIEALLPKDQQLYCVTTATTHYAKGLAFAATGDVRSAKQQQELFHQTRALVPSSRRAYNSKAIETLAVAAAMLDGEISYRERHYKKAWQCFRTSIELDDSLPYSEPWAWMQPSRHAYAALLLEQGHLEEAAGQYQADLGLDESLIRPRRHPKNVWALQGYHECLSRMGRREDAAGIEPVLKEALSTADVPIRASCFCRLNTSEAPRVVSKGESKESRL
ncbi:hypothetical protein BJY04DRAFT_196687 [Aspergillus karnatakaensis]|uniref:uncharacterized protein n=1 Tax=Aspergillus karnatakaensis TaxID=1810916 RepID=UPI003CCD9153